MVNEAVTGRVWLFDVDGCLVDAVTGGSLRPHARELLVELRRRDIPVVVWSAGGAEYARRRAEEHGVAGLVVDFYGKGPRDGDGRWSLQHLEPEHAPLLLIDDEPQGLPLGCEAVAVRPYLGPGSHDVAFRDLFHRLG